MFSLGVKFHFFLRKLNMATFKVTTRPSLAVLMVAHS